MSLAFGVLGLRWTDKPGIGVRWQPAQVQGDIQPASKLLRDDHCLDGQGSYAFG
jgi:hypothetical protein